MFDLSDHRAAPSSTAPARRASPATSPSRTAGSWRSSRGAPTDAEADDHHRRRPAGSSAPGFVDIHTHYDAQILWDRMLTVSPWHGVTTVVTGNCGFGVAPTRPAHRDLIVRTLEKVEGMSADALRAGLGERVAVRDVPRVPRRGRGPRPGHQRGRDDRPHAGAARRAWARRRPSARPRPTRSPACAPSSPRPSTPARSGFATSKSTTHVGYEGRPVPSRAADGRRDHRPSPARSATPARA